MLQELASAQPPVVLVLGGGAALALPEGMVVRGGQLELSNPSATETLIRQGTNRAAAPPLGRLKTIKTWGMACWKPTSSQPCCPWLLRKSCN